jgi:hypothetical protein
MSPCPHVLKTRWKYVGTKMQLKLRRYPERAGIRKGQGGGARPAPSGYQSGYLSRPPYWSNIPGYAQNQVTCGYQTNKIACNDT